MMTKEQLEYHRRWREKNKDRVKTSRDNYRSNNREHYNNLQRKAYQKRVGAYGPYKLTPEQALLKRLYPYKLTVEQYNQMYVNQQGKCAICSEQFGNTKKTSSRIDHCRDSNVIRGLLCHCCNVAIGHLRHNPELTRKATKYLENSIQSPIFHI